MVRDNGGAQNKGWFGRKKNSVTPPQKVSRPPSASSFTPYKRKSQVSEMSGTDDDLPPREGLPERTEPSGSPPPQTEKGKETEETPDGDAKESAPTVPLHAGFDFEAIKGVLRESKDSEGGKPSTVLLSPVPEHMIPPASPVPRSGSAPPYTSTQPPPSHSRLSQDFTRDYSTDGSGVSDVLTPAFSRSLSLADTPGAGTNKVFTSFNTLGPEIPTRSPLASNSPSLSFGGYDGSIWQAPSNDVYQSGATGSTPSLPEGRVNGSHGYLPSSPTVNPFVSRSSLSFGGTGGTIDYVPSTSIVPSSNNEADPWSSLVRGKKPISGLNSNPWA